MWAETVTLDQQDRAAVYSRKELDRERAGAGRRYTTRSVSEMMPSIVVWGALFFPEKVDEPFLVVAVNNTL